MKLLWGKAAGRCSNPDCRTKLLDGSDGGENYITGEMAHIVARKLGGPRAKEEIGPDTYDNLILLCPSCHTKIDKAPEEAFPREILQDWKKQHEEWIDDLMVSGKFISTGGLFKYISKLLEENKYYWKKYGPKSDLSVENPESDAYYIWVSRKLDTILPNNRKILNSIDVNDDLIPEETRNLVREFQDHAVAFEESQYYRKESYRQFPDEFGEVVREIAQR